MKTTMGFIRKKRARHALRSSETRTNFAYLALLLHSALTFAALALLLAAAGCAHLYEDENPAGPTGEQVSDDDQTDDDQPADTTSADNITVENLRWTALFAPAENGNWGEARTVFLIEPSDNRITPVLSRGAQELGIYSMTLSRDNTEFVFLSMDPKPTGGYEAGAYVAALDGSFLLQIPLPSPHINTVAISQEKGIACAESDPAGGTTIWVENMAIFGSPAHYIGSLAWDETGLELYTAINPINPSNRLLPRGIYQINVTDGTPTAIITADSSSLAADPPVIEFLGVSQSEGRLLFFTMHDDLSFCARTIKIDGTEHEKVYQTYDWGIMRGQLAGHNQFLVYGSESENRIIAVDLNNGTTETVLRPTGAFAFFN